MSRPMTSRRQLDVPSLVAAWPAMEPPDDFADRVLAACAARSAPARPAPRARLGALMLCAAVALAAFASLPLLLHRAAEPRSPAMASLPFNQDLGDLGAERD